MKVLKVAGRVLLKNFKYITLILVVFLVAFSFYSKYKPARAGVGDLELSGGIYSIDDSGKVYKKQDSLDLKETPLSGEISVPAEYYAYLFDPYPNEAEQYTVNSSTNLTVRGNATVMMEGSQDLANLTVTENAKVTQPLPDRYGNVNRPVYTRDYWGATFTGFFKLEAHTRYRLFELWKNDFASIEVKSGGTIKDNEYSWNVVYRNGSEITDGWSKINDTEGNFKTSFNTDSTNYKNWLENSTGSARYVPIKISFADKTGSTEMDFRYRMFDDNDTWNPKGADSNIPKASFYGVNSADGTVNTTKSRVTNFDYYVVEGSTGLPQFGFANCVRTAGKTNLNLGTDFDGFGDMDYDPTYSDKMAFTWDQYQTPYGRTYSEYPSKRAPRYSAELLNSSAMETSRMIPAGLSLNVSGETKIEGDGHIDLDGAGYPGYASEFDGRGSTFGRRGGSTDFSGALGGGYPAVGAKGCTGTGGSHAGQGGFQTEGNGCHVETRPGKYGSQYNPSTMGSGGGVSTRNTSVNIAGSGGGLLKLVTNKLTVNSSEAIQVSGDSGEYVAWHTNTGGAGGAINITVNGNFTVGTDGKIMRVDGANGWPVGATPANSDWHVGGGGGYILINYDPSNSNRDKSALTEQLSAKGGDGGFGEDLARPPDRNNDGTDGIVTLEINTICSATDNLVVSKRTLTKNQGASISSGIPSATFEAGQNVGVELLVSEPRETRDDFVIEDAVPSTVTGEIRVCLKNSTDTDWGRCKSPTVKDGKIRIEGAADFQLTRGENSFWYEYWI